MEIRLSKNKLQTLNAEEVAVYTALKMKFDSIKVDREKDVIVNTTIYELSYLLSGSYDEIKRKTKDKLLDGLNSLIEKNIIELIDNNAKKDKVNDNTHFALNIKNLWINTDKNNDNKENFLTTSDNEIKKIINIEHKSKLELFKFALNVLGTINYNDKTGYSSIATLQNISGIKSNKTAVEFMKLLEENDVLYIKHSDSAKRDSNGQIKNLSNCYGRPSSQLKVDSFYAKRRKEQGGFDFTIDRIESSKKAQIKKDYTAFKNKKYKGDVVELCARVIAYNQDYYTVQNEQQKDLSIFDEETINKAQEISIKETVNNINEQEEKETVNSKKQIIHYKESKQEDTPVEEEIPIQEDKIVIIPKRFSGRITGKEVDKELIHKNNTPLESEIKFMNECYQKILDKKLLNEIWEVPMLKEFERKYNWSIDKYSPKKILEENPF